MDNQKYYEVSPGIRMALPKTLPPDEVERRISKYKKSLERDKEQAFNPKTNKFNPCK